MCRPLYTVPATPDDSDQSTPASVPQAASPAPGKVQKSGRRQSHIQAAPENIAKALEAMPVNPKLEDGVPNYLDSLPQHQHGLNDNHSSSLKDTPSPPPVATSNGKSCCGGKSSASVVPNPMTAQQSTPTQPHVWDENAMPYMGYPWQNPMPPTQTSLMQPFGMQNTPASQLYVDNYSSNMASAPYSLPMNGLRISEGSMAPFTASQNSYAPATSAGGDACQDCQCGDDCQCLGCAAHPFNNRTRQHVQEMGVLMSFDGEDLSTEAMAKPWKPQYSLHSTPAPMSLQNFMQQPPPMSHGMHQNQNPYESYSDPNSAMPSGYSSPLPAGHQLDQQLMHPSEYLTLEYPVGLPSACSDITGSCQCGNDCSCFGCVTHSGHNGIPLDAPLPETSETTEHQISSQGMAISNSNGSHTHTSRFPVLENASVPCLSPRNFETSMI